MITRYALFEGTVKPGRTEEFRDVVMRTMVPLWERFPGALGIRVFFGESRDLGAPEFPLILAVDYPDRAAVDAALASVERTQARVATEVLVAEFFDGRIHHHLTDAHEFPPVASARSGALALG